MSEFASIHSECIQKLHLEQGNVSRLKETVLHLDTLTGTIVEALDGLDKKLTDMETLLLPVRDQTDQLKLKASNAEQTVRKLQSVQEHYATLSQTDKLIDLGPASCDVTSYLEAMTKLRAAAEFFGNVNPGQFHATTARNLYSNGREKLLQYLDKILVQYAGHLTVQNLAGCIDVVDISEINHFPELMPEAGVGRVAAIWDWFEKNNPPTAGQTPDYAEIVARALSRSLGQLLTRLNEHLARCVCENDITPDLAGSVSQRRSSLALRDRRTQTAYTTLPPQAVQHAGTLRQPVTPSGPGNSKMPQTPASGVANSFAAIFEDPARQSAMVESLCAACFVLMRAHCDLVSRILGCSKKSNLSSGTITIAVSLVDRITRALFEHVGDAAASLCKAARRYAHQAPATSVAMLIAMQQLDNLLLHLEQPQSPVEKLTKQRLQFLPLPERAQKRLNESLTEVRRAACSALYSLLALAAAEPAANNSANPNDNPTTTPTSSKQSIAEMPRDGTVHETTAGVIRALEDLLPLTKLAGQALSVSSQHPQASSVASRRPSGTPSAGTLNGAATNSPANANSGAGLTHAMLWFEYEERLRLAIVNGIQRRADMYGDDASLRAVFVLNNAGYVVKNLQRIDASQQQQHTSNKAMTHLRSSSTGSVSSSWAVAVDKLLRSARVAYLSSWGHLGSLVMLPPNAGPIVMNFKDKDRQAIKDKFSTFNSELEQLTAHHRRYSVVDTAQRSELLSAAAGEVTTPYKVFLDRYAASNFTTNRGKYIKYSEEDIRRLVSGCLSGQFSGNK